jgi:altronate hydrolase
MLTRSSLTIRLHPNDDVVIALAQLVGGTNLLDEKITVSGLVPPGHKVATRAIKAGHPVRRYNQIIGFASRDIAPGEHVHLNNLAMGAFDRDYAFGRRRQADAVCVATGNVQRHRARAGPNEGRVATRNYIGILSTVNCSATVARGIAGHFTPERLAAFPNVDGVVALTHGSGCGMDTHGEGMLLLRRTLGGYARHPNMAGVLMIGLGCEANQISSLMGAQNLQEGPLLQTFSIQDTGGTAKTIAHGIKIIEEMLPHANEVTRQPVPASHITVGLQCGGLRRLFGDYRQSALGAAVDLLVRNGGTAILSETPEIYGAEHLLTRRAVSLEVGEKLISRIKWWEDYTTREKGEMNNNPSPGNKAGGLTTILEKSLGAVAKGGTTNLVAVYEYAEPVTAKGFVYMDTPRLRSGVGHGSGGGRREHDRVHHRARLGLRLCTRAVAQAVDQHAALDQAGRGHRPQLRRDRRRHRVGRRARATTVSTNARYGLGHEIEERKTWLRPKRVRAVVPGRGHVADVAPGRIKTVQG